LPGACGDPTQGERTDQRLKTLITLLAKLKRSAMTRIT
jgi:hypothetical protein